MGTGGVDMEIIQSVKIIGVVKVMSYNILTGKIESSVYKNIVPTVGRTAIARRLVNARTKSNEGIITYGALGTGETAPANTDTTLETEIIRKVLFSRSNTDNVAQLIFYIDPTEGNGYTYKEFGLFGEDAGAGADSGTLFERVAIDKEKTSADALQVISTLTIS